MTTRTAQQITDELIAEGHAMEAAEYAKMVAYALPESEARALIATLADAILSPVPRKRGDKFVNHPTFEKLVAEMAIGDKVVKSGKRVTVAFDQIGQDKKGSKSVGTVKRLYYKHKTKDST